MCDNPPTDYISPIGIISEGEMCWEGNRKEILNAENQKLQEFVFANKQYQKIRDEKINDQ